MFMCLYVYVCFLYARPMLICYPRAQASRVIGRAKRASHWGVQSRFRVIYIYIKKKAFKINAKIEDVGLNED